MLPGDDAPVLAAAPLFDRPPTADLVRDFLARSGHHLLVAIDDHEVAIGFVSGIETAHPDKAAEMLVYELAVAPAARRRGVATALLDALTRVAADAGLRGVWVITGPDTEAALATYRHRDASETSAVMFEWPPSDDGPPPTRRASG